MSAAPCKHGIIGHEDCCEVEVERLLEELAAYREFYEARIAFEEVAGDEDKPERPAIDRCTAARARIAQLKGEGR